MSVLSILFALWIGVGPAAAQQPEGGAPGATPGQLQGMAAEGTIAVAVVFPPDVEDVSLVAMRNGSDTPVLFSNDGSYRQDLPEDGEWWAVLYPGPGDNVLTISGRADGRKLWHTEVTTIPMAWMGKTYPVTLLATPTSDGWKLTRVVLQSLPPPSAPTGQGVSSQGQRLGLSPLMLYLIWGGLGLSLALAATLRSAILRVRLGELERG